MLALFYIGRNAVVWTVVATKRAEEPPAKPVSNSNRHRSHRALVLSSRLYLAGIAPPAM